LITGSSKEEIMEFVTDHGKREHNLKDSDFSPELVNKIKSLITESKE
jgi:predicted small metal-binding protein